MPTPLDRRIVGVLPAAGMATRMGGLPKFLLPVLGDSSALLDRHVSEMLKVVSQVVIPTRPENASLLGRYGDQPGVTVICMTTATMSETVLRVNQVVRADAYVLGMPDTYFHGESPYRRLVAALAGQTDLALALWRIRPSQRGKLGQIELNEGTRVTSSQDKDSACEYPWSWGAIAYSESILSLLNPGSPHIGYIIQPAVDASKSVIGLPMSGEYYDCGSATEYREVLNLESQS